MKKIHIYTDEEVELRYDLKRIQDAFADKDISISRREAKILWEKYSAESSAGWLSMEHYSNRKIYECVEKFFEVID